MEIVLCRHAEPAWINEEGRAVLDPPLSERGQTQALAMADAVAARWAESGARLAVSPTRRTRQTAAPLIDLLGVEPTIVSWAEEMRLPAQLDGKPADLLWNDLRAARHAPPAAWWDGLGRGETYTAFHARVTDGLIASLADWGVLPVESEPGCFWLEAAGFEQTVILVGHGGTNAVVIGHLLGVAPVPWPWERFVLAHASITVLRTAGVAGHRIFGLHVLSDTGHLVSSRELV